MTSKRTNLPNLKDLKKSLLGGDMRALSRAITLAESTREDQQDFSARLLEAVMDKTGKSIRIGITGVPGVGKSTFIEALGMYLINKGKKVGVLAIDPSSEKSGGSILGDKTRMNKLARTEKAFIRPSPTSGKLGGVAAHTREAILLLEAAGFDVIFVETVGAGQSETDVARMVDFFLVLQLPGAGDELQGVKKGVLEMADMVVINKAEESNRKNAVQAVRDFKAALHIVTPKEVAWHPPVLMCSALEKQGLEDIWEKVEEFEKKARASGALGKKRKNQSLYWMWAVIEGELLVRFKKDEKIQKGLKQKEKEVLEGDTTPSRAARQLIELYLKN